MTALSYTNECEVSGLVEGFCAHCTGDQEINEAEGFETVAIFEAQFSGHCAIEYGHKVKRGDLVSKIQHADNPMIPVSGVACKSCTRMLPKATT